LKSKCRLLGVQSGPWAAGSKNKTEANKGNKDMKKFLMQ